MAKKSSKKAQAETKAKAANKRRRKRRRRGNNALYFLLVFFLALGIGIMLSLTVFFNVETIEVEGRGRYSQTEIVATSGIAEGDNLFRIDQAKAAEQLKAKFPFIENVTIKRSFPATAVIVIEEAVPIGSFMQEDGSYYLISNKGRVLDLRWEAPPEQYLKVIGVALEDLVPCNYLDIVNNDSFTAFDYLNTAITNTGFVNITKIDLSSSNSIEIVYEDRILIKLGSVADLVKKLDFAKYALETEIKSTFEGIMDITIAGQLRYRSAEIHLEGYHVTEEQPPKDGETDLDDGEGTQLEITGSGGEQSSGGT